MKERIIKIASGVVLVLSGCGVKGPPLPPVADTPNASDRAEVSRPAPSPTPSPTPKTKRRH